MAKGFFKSIKASTSCKPVRISGCATCGLSRGCCSPKMPFTGDGKISVLVVAEAPGEQEDRTGTQLVGKAGQALRKELKSLGVDLDADCYKTNAVRCRPPNNRRPTPQEVASCRKALFDDIAATKPKVILALGGCAVESLLGHRWTNDGDLSITRWRGLTPPDQQLQAWVCPTFHPSYVERERSWQPAVSVLWRKDLKQALQLVESPLPASQEPKITMVMEPDGVKQYLLQWWKAAKTAEMGKPFIIALDYETTGLKPYGADHKIWSCSVATSPTETVAWPWKLMTNELLGLWRALMETPACLKIGANIKFEQVWTRAKCGHTIEGWLWDTVLAAKVCDNRPGNSSVAFQSYTKLGILGFKDATQQMLKAKNSNALNSIDRIPIEDLLTRNAKDSAYEYAVALWQMEEFNGKRL